MTMVDEYEFKVKKKSEAERDLEDAGDKVKAGANAVKNKIEDPSRDLDFEYNKEKLKEKLD